MKGPSMSSETQDGSRKGSDAGGTDDELHPSNERLVEIASGRSAATACEAIDMAADLMGHRRRAGEAPALCEACERIATTEDAEGVPLCDACAKSLDDDRPEKANADCVPSPAPQAVPGDGLNTTRPIYLESVHLGDGAYASFDGSQIWLHTGSHMSPGLVALEANVFKELLQYARRAGIAAIDKPEGGAA